jgi:hypothetical protein
MEAQECIDFIRAEPAADDLIDRENIREIEYLNATKESLKAIYSVQDGQTCTDRLANIDASRLLHVNQDNASDIKF